MGADRRHRAQRQARAREAPGEGFIESSPRRGRIVPELLRFGIRAWRELLVAPYRVVYRVGGTSVIILAVFDGRRDLEDLLLERLLQND